MEGAYVGFQPKPAVEIILVISKGKTLTWLDDCRIPYQSEDDYEYTNRFLGEGNKGLENYRRGNERQGYDKLIKIPQPAPPANEKGRFPANLLVSDDVLNDGHNYKVGDIDQTNHRGKKQDIYGLYGAGPQYTKKGDEGSYSRYFSLDQWASKTFPFLIVPKPPKSEKGEFNNHPTVKSQKLMSYLITMGSREGDLVLDPFCGSGTTLLAAHQLHRKYLGIELNPEYITLAKERLAPIQSQLKIELWNDG
jgi:site-specific DNA-methyltransferase (adenine-specific)